MGSKIKDLEKQLNINFKGIQEYAIKLGIEITSETDEVSDSDAKRLISTISLMSGTAIDEKSKTKAIPKAVPMKPKPQIKSKSPALTPVKKEEVKESETPEKKPDGSISLEAKTVKTSKVSKTETPAKTPKPEPIETKTESDDYQNAPNKPMRFKKIGEAKGTTSKSKNQSQESGRNKGNKSASKPKTSDAKHQPASSTENSTASKSQGRGKSKKFFNNSKDKDKQSRYDRREDGPGSRNRNNSNTLYDDLSLEKQERHKRKNKPKPIESAPIEETLPEGTIAVTVPITVAGLSEQAEISVSRIIMSMMQMGVLATVNQTLDKDAVEMLALDLGVDIVVTQEEQQIIEEGIDTREDNENELEPRAPIITVMGHVDHGKTSLLDAIRNTNVTAKESGGITQHIGAYEVSINNKKIVFLDTPGHEAFATMRARGAQVTDIAVLVVAADDGVMPQTIESISHAKAASVPIIVAINKIDKPGANPDKVKAELTEHGVVVEEYGGNVISVPVSAKQGTGIQDLLEMILLQAEVLELKANPDRLASGTVIEARLDKSKGPVATLLVSNGTLKSGQSIVAGTCSGKIRVMTNYLGETIRKALPATPVEVLGLNDVPAAGDSFNAVSDDKTAREIADNRARKLREDVLAKDSTTSLNQLFSQIEAGSFKELNIIVKGDVQGSVGAIITSLEKLETDKVKINIIHSGVGTINESDVMLAETSGAIIIGFNVRPSSAVSNQASEAGVEMRLYRVIYDIIDDISDAMQGLLDPEYQELVLGKAEVRETFKVPNVGVIAGCYVQEGKIKRNESLRLVRDGIVIHEGAVSSLRRFKDDVKEVQSGYECGIGIEDYQDLKVGDIIECFTMEQISK